VHEHFEAAQRHRSSTIEHGSARRILPVIFVEMYSNGCCVSRGNRYTIN
jgi:hypothetical protein